MEAGEGCIREVVVVGSCRRRCYLHHSWAVQMGGNATHFRVYRHPEEGDSNATLSPCLTAVLFWSADVQRETCFRSLVSRVLTFR